MPSRIVGTGIALPKRVVTNAELSRVLKIPEAHIEKRTGVRTRHWVSAGETCATLATEAARVALACAQVPAAAIDFILVSTTSADYAFPSTACLVQKALGAHAAAAFDLGASCAGFLYALSVADTFIRNKTATHALVIAAEVKSLFLDPNDVATSILFGDGAGAVVLTEGRRGIRSLRLWADGAGHRLITLPAGGARQPTTQASLDQGLHYMKMDGQRLFRVAVKKMKAVVATLEADGVNSLLFHQANLRILEAVLGEKMARTHVTLDRWGNTSSASLPMVLDDALRQGKVTPGDRVGLCAFGGGITWGYAVIEGISKTP